MKIVIEHLCWIFLMEIAMKYVLQVISGGIVDRRKIKKINKYLINYYYTDRFVKDHWSIKKMCEYLISILIHQHTLNPQ